MAFTLKNFGNEVANVKNILGGISFYTYDNAAGDTVTTAGFFPSDLGLKADDRILVIGADRSKLDVWYYVSDITDGVVTVAALTANA